MSSDPSVGRIVHYVLPTGSPHQGEHRPAMITQVWQGLDHESAPGMSNLAVFKGQSIDFNTPYGCGVIGDRNGPVVALGSVLYSEAHAPGTWHWPEQI